MLPGGVFLSLLLRAESPQHVPTRLVVFLVSLPTSVTQLLIVVLEWSPPILTRLVPYSEHFLALQDGHFFLLSQKAASFYSEGLVSWKNIIPTFKTKFYQ